MATVSNQGVSIDYEVTGQGRPLVLMHGWSCDRTWWIHAGYTADLERDFRVINIDLRGHGASDKPHDPMAYRAEAVVGDVMAVLEAEGVDRFAIWGLSYGGWIGWMTGQAAPARVAALVSSGSWDPRPDPDGDFEEFDSGWGRAIRDGGMAGLIDVFKEEGGDSYSTEFPPWAEATTLRADPAALLAIQARELFALGEGVADVERFPVPTLLISGELEDEKDEAALMASELPHGESLRLAGLGHGGACAASALTLPAARGFLDRWYVS